MALQKPFEFHGIDFNDAYHKVSQLYIDVDRNIVRVTVKIYKDEQARIDNPEVPIQTQTLFLARPGSEENVADYIGQPLDVRQVVYDKLKETTEYTDAIDL